MYKLLEKPYVLSIAGLDPTAGAGILADVKTFTGTGSYGFAVATCLTAQTEDYCSNVQWLSIKEITEQLQPLLENYTIAFAKIGAIKDASTAFLIMEYVKKIQPGIRFIWDPILLTSSGHEFMKINTDFRQTLSNAYLLTPNFPEVMLLTGDGNALEGAVTLSMHTNVFLKGGHEHENRLMDRLFENGNITEFPKQRDPIHTKHGSGCVVSAAITSYLAQGYLLKEACERGSQYMSTFFASSETKLGIH